MIDAGALNYMIEFHKKNPDCNTRIIYWAFANIASEDANVKNVVKSGIIELMVKNAPKLGKEVINEGNNYIIIVLKLIKNKITISLILFILK